MIIRDIHGCAVRLDEQRKYPPMVEHFTSLPGLPIDEGDSVLITWRLHNGLVEGRDDEGNFLLTMRLRDWDRIPEVTEDHYRQLIDHHNWLSIEDGGP